MPDYELVDIEVTKDLPNFAKGPALVYKLTLKGPNGEETAEMFSMASNEAPKVGDTLQGEITQSDYGPKFQKGGGKGGGGGFKKSPAETKAIQRQHSQEMALRREQNILAAGGRPYSGPELHRVINWFEQDIASKDRTQTWDGSSEDLPVETDGLPGV